MRFFSVDTGIYRLGLNVDVLVEPLILSVEAIIMVAVSYFVPLGL